MDAGLFVFLTDEFLVRDYCAGMSYSEKPDIVTHDKDIELDCGLIEQGQMQQNQLSESGESADDPWVCHISKHVLSEASTFSIPYVSYQRYEQPQDWNTDCGDLTYDLIEYSYDANTERDFFKKLEIQGEQNGADEGVQISLVADRGRHQKGHYSALMVIRPNPAVIPISNKRYILFEIEYLDCKVTSLTAGVQEFTQSSQLMLNEQLTFAFHEYV